MYVCKYSLFLLVTYLFQCLIRLNLFFHAHINQDINIKAQFHHNVSDTI